MRMSHLFGQTLRDAPTEAEVDSHKLLVRAGFIRQLGAGLFSYLLLAKRSLTKIENIMRDEINAIGGQELSMPVVHPADLWKETGRWYQIGSEMGRFLDKTGHDMVLAMTHEEIVADLVRRDVQSYRQLPMLVYHIQTKWRDDPRPRAGLIRAREFTMLDSYSLDPDLEHLDQQYRAHFQAYFNIFNRCALPTIAVGADVGMMGGTLAHEFMYLTPIGEDTLLLCDHCGYSANRQIAHFRKPAAAADERSEEPLPLEKVATPHVATIEALAAFLKVPKTRTAKAVFMMAMLPDGQGQAERFVFALVRGDMEVNETKLANAIKAKELRPAREDEIRAVGAVPGYASPLGLDPKQVLIVVDDLVPRSPNLVGGANEAGYHMLNTNYGRDFTASVVTDIATAGEGDACPNCGQPLRVSRGVEVGNIFKLGTRYTQALGANFLDKDGSIKPVIMGSYGIGSGRLLACVAEAHHDADGLRWPVTVAPYQVQLVVLPDSSGGAQREADALYASLQAAGVEVLYDDRDERAGVKFKDADLIGLPLRVTVSERSLKQGGIELKRRDQTERTIVPLADTLARVQSELAALRDEIVSRVVPTPYPQD